VDQRILAFGWAFGCDEYGAQTEGFGVSYVDDVREIPGIGLELRDALER
jgi:hypothetical protein